MRNLIATLLLLAGGSVAAQDTPPPAAMERLLIPLAAIPGIPGAFGSYWETELWFRNDGDNPVFVFAADPALCRLATCAPPVVPPRTETTIPNERHCGVQASFLYVERRALPDVVTTLHVRDVTRSGLSHGTELPVIRERELMSGKATLLAVPADPRFRVTLRVYDLDKREADVLVRVYGMFHSEQPLIGEKRIPFITCPEWDTERYAMYPGFASINIHSEFPEIAQYGRVRVEVTPDSLQTRFWALITVTNNETQQVTTITP